PILRFWTLMSLTRWPRTKISPSVGTSRPAINRSTVVLPPPLGPSKASNSPSRTEKVTLVTALTPPNCLLTALSSMLMDFVLNGCPLRHFIRPSLLPFQKSFNPQREQGQH